MSVSHVDRVIIGLPWGQGQPSRIWKVRCDWVSVAEEKGESLKTLEGFRGGTTQNCLENEDMGEGVAKVIKCY